MLLLSDGRVVQLQVETSSSLMCGSAKVPGESAPAEPGSPYNIGKEHGSGSRPGAGHGKTSIQLPPSFRIMNQRWARMFPTGSKLTLSLRGILTGALQIRKGHEDQSQPASSTMRLTAHNSSAADPVLLQLPISPNHASPVS